MAVIDNLIFTKTSAFALYWLNGVSYHHLADDAKKLHVLALNSVLQNFSGRGQIFYLSEELNVSASEYLDGVPVTFDPGLREEVRRHVDAAVDFLAYNRAQRRRAYLCLQLPVQEAITYTLHDFRDQFLEWFAALRKPANISKRAVEQAKLAESELYNSVSADLDVTRAGFDDFEFIVRRAVERYGPLPNPVPDREEVALSPGVLTALTAGALIDAKLRYLVVDVNGKQVYQTFVTFADVPRYLPVVGKEWLAAVDRTCDFPVDAVVHFEIMRPEKARKKVDAKKKMLKEQLEEHHVGQGEAPRSQEWASVIAGDLEAKIEEGMPLTRFGAVFAVAGGDLNEMRSCARVVFQKFGPWGFKVCTPPGDMLKCLYMFFPGAEFHRSLPGIHSDPGYVASSVPMASTEVGDEKGFLLGFAGSTPAFFLPGKAMQGGSGAAALTGTQGGGKSMCGKTLLYYSLLCGAKAFGIDPKDELKAFSKLPFSVRKVDFSPGGSAPLNPFSFSPDPRRAATVANDFLGILLEAHRDEMAARRMVISHAVQKVVSSGEKSLYAVLQTLDDMAGAVPGGAVGEEEIREARVCSRLLRMVQGNALGQMLFGTGGGGEFEGKEQLTVVNLKELPLPKVSDVQTVYDQVTESEKIAVAMLFLVAAAAREAVFREDPKRLKVLYLDEAYHLLRIPAGYRLVTDLLRMSRSFNIMPILITQNPSDLDENIRNNLGYAFAFRMKGRQEAASARELLGLPAVEDEEELDAFAEELGTFPDGYCFMRDPKNRVAEVQITPQPRYLLDVFDTRPGKGAFAEQ